MLSRRNSRSMHSSKGNGFRDLTDRGFTPTPSPIQSPPQSDHGGEAGEACDDEEGVPDVPMEHTSCDSGAAGDAARPVAGTAKKRRCLGSADVMRLWRERAEKSKNMEEGTLGFLRLQAEEAYERDSVLLGSQG